MKPSEMVAGLDAAAKRAEKLDARESAKRKGGGGTLNVALHVDDTGSKWKRMVVLSILGTVLFIVALGAFALWFSSRKSISPEEGNGVTREMLRDMVLIAAQMKPSDADEKMTPEKAKAHLTEGIKAQLADVLERIKQDGESHHPTTGSTFEEKHELENMLKFEDAWGVPFTFAVDGEKITVTAKGRPDSKGRTIEPVSFQFPHAKGK